MGLATTMICLGALASAGAAHAATITVTTTTDSIANEVLAGSEANPAAAVGDLDVTDPLTIQGAGATTTTIDANGIDRSSDDFSILRAQGITFTGGRAQSESPDGGAIRFPGPGGQSVTGGTDGNRRRSKPVTLTFTVVRR